MCTAGMPPPRSRGAHLGTDGGGERRGGVRGRNGEGPEPGDPPAEVPCRGARRAPGTTPRHGSARQGQWPAVSAGRPARSPRRAAALPVRVELVVLVVLAAGDALHAGGEDAPLDEPRGQL